MPQFLLNILSVSKYEALLLTRSWFFKVFAIILTLWFGFFVYDKLVMNGNWAIECIPSVFPYIILLQLSIGQAIVSIFLASEYLKRDKQLDTSEVFYVRPLSNAEYLLGKMWGTLRVFFLLDLFLIGGGLIGAWVLYGNLVNVWDALLYFGLLVIPTLLYVVGLSTAVMLFIRNQALTFVIVLGYVGLTTYYIGDFFYYVFDFLGFNIPMMKSTITGFADLPSLLNHRLIYFLAGIGLIFLSIFKFGRLGNSHRHGYLWLGGGTFILLLSLVLGVKHVIYFVEKEQYQQSLVALNNRFVNEPKMVVDSCRLDIRQQQELLQIEAELVASPAQDGSKFTFSLNPGFEILDVKQGGQPVKYERNEHLLFVDFEREIKKGERIGLTIHYCGVADERICYLDIPEEMLISNEQNNQLPFVNIGKRYLYQTSDYVLLTPESYWYPRPGVGYSDESPDWQQNYFTHYSLHITPNKGLTPVSQGARTLLADSSFLFAHEQRMHSLTLIIGDYNYVGVTVDSTEYGAHFLASHDYFTAYMDTIKDTIPSLIREARRVYENVMKLPYPFNRFAYVEVPAMFATYSRAWTQQQETMQPEMVLLPEKGYKFWQFNFKGQVAWRKDYMKRGHSQHVTDYDLKKDAFNGALWMMNNRLSDFRHEEGKLGRNKHSFRDNPLYIFPQMYNFKYNIYSNQWPVANKMMELFIQGGPQENEWMRQVNGLSNDEKAILKMRNSSFKKLLTETKSRELINHYIYIESKLLFAQAQYKMGLIPFRDSLFNLIKKYEFDNLSYEFLLDSMSRFAQADIVSPMEKWSEPSALPEYVMGTPVVTKITTKEKDLFQTEMVISNVSDVEGYVQYGFWFNSSWGNEYGPGLKPRNWLVHFKPKETKRIVSHWEEESPVEFQVHTILSKNLPLYVKLPAGPVTESRMLTPEGEYEVSSDFLLSKGETIIDNEDTLFSLSADAPSGFLNSWIEKSLDEEDLYPGLVSWRPPLKWTLSTSHKYYGMSVRSAVGIRSGDGKHTATWKVPVVEHGKHELYYYVTKPDDLNWGRHEHKGYLFNVSFEDYKDEVNLEINHIDEGWAYMGTYDIDCDTLQVVMNNKSKLRLVIADAVKLVNVDESGTKRRNVPPRRWW